MYQNITQGGQKQIIIVMIPNGRRGHNLAVKKSSALLTRIFQCLKYRHLKT